MNEQNSLPLLGSQQSTNTSHRITYIGHATLLLRFGAVCVLTDPNFDEKLGVLLPRVTAPGVQIAELPHIDAILITHAHADHLSFRTLHTLPSGIPIYAPPAVARWLLRVGIPAVRAVEPGQTFSLGTVSVTVARADHVGARYGIDRWRGAANMYLLDDGRASVLFTGDTSITPNAAAVARTILPRRVDVALLPIGNAPPWKIRLFRRGHLTPADALSLFEQIDARIFIPFHWGTFRHITSGAYDAIRILRSVLETYPRASQVKILAPGESFTIVNDDR